MGHPKGSSKGAQICASHRGWSWGSIVSVKIELAEQAVREGRFREDLFYRLNVINIEVPPLRNRSGDIPLLCEYFIGKFKHSFNRPDIDGLSHAALQQLFAYHWPGNVRELENALERAVILAEGRYIEPENFPENIRGSREGCAADFLAGVTSIKEGKRRVEERLIRRALESTQGNKSQAAQLLEVSYPSLLSKIKEYDIQNGREDR